MTYMTVCDISRHNGEIDFNVMASKAVGVAIRATVGDYYTDPRFDEKQHHLAAKVLLAVRRRNGEVALLVAGFVAQVRVLHATRVPASLG